MAYAITNYSFPGVAGSNPRITAVLDSAADVEALGGTEKWSPGSLAILAEAGFPTLLLSKSNGWVNGMGLAYQQKYLRMEAEPRHQETAICKCGGHYFYYDVNPFYVDVLDKKVIAKFIEVAYKPYYERYGNRVEGFFTDEPQISRTASPGALFLRKNTGRGMGRISLSIWKSCFWRWATMPGPASGSGRWSRSCSLKPI